MIGRYSVLAVGIMLCVGALGERYVVTRYAGLGNEFLLPFRDGFLQTRSILDPPNVRYVVPSAGTSVALVPGGAAFMLAVNSSAGLFITYNQAEARTELWRTDGTAEGTAMYFSEPEPYLLDSVDSDAFALGVWPGFFLRIVPSGLLGELWVTDGTEGGTLRVSDFVSLEEDAVNPSVLGRAGANLIWVQPAAEAGGTATLWSCNGDTRDVTPLHTSVALNSIDVNAAQSINGLCYFFVEDETPELWRTDGSVAGTFKLSDLPFNDGGGLLREGNGLVVAQVRQGSSTNPVDRHFVLTDGTVLGTRTIGLGAFSPAKMQVIAPIDVCRMFVAEIEPGSLRARYGYLDLESAEFTDVFGPRTVTHSVFHSSVYLDENVAVLEGDAIYFPLKAFVVAPRGTNGGTKSRDFVGVVKATPVFDSAELVSCADTNDVVRGAGSVQAITDGFVTNDGLEWDVHVRREGFCLFEADDRHMTDINNDFMISLSELLRAIQFYNFGGYSCAGPGEITEDGFKPGGIPSCGFHDLDYQIRDGDIDLSELLRGVQFYNAGGFYWCPKEYTEDDFCVGVQG